MFGTDALASSPSTETNRYKDPLFLRSSIVNGGFLLLETILAVLILSVGLSVVIRSFGSSLNFLRASDDYTQAMLLLEEKMWDLEAKGSITPGTSRGTFLEDDVKFQWQINASVPNGLDLCETEVTVSWKHRGGERNISLVTYLRSGTEAQR